MSEESDLEESNRLARERARDLERTIDLRFQVEAFLAGELGQLLLADAADEREALVDDYLKLNPALVSDSEAMQDIRFKIAVLDHWQDAFGQYIADGKSAEAQYQAEGVTSEEP